jgi:hypothetical protein
VSQALDDGVDFPWADWAFPDREDRPAGPKEPTSVRGVPEFVATELVSPKRGASGGGGATFPACVAVPKAAVNEDDFSEGGKDNVGGAGKVATVEAEAVAERVDESTDEHFGFRVLAANRPHDVPAFLGGEDVAPRP